MKTAIQEHIEWLKATLEICKENAPSLINCLKLCLKDAESKLEIEKEQIMSAWHNGLANQTEFFSDHTGTIIRANCAEQYYNETFKKE